MTKLGKYSFCDVWVLYEQIILTLWIPSAPLSPRSQSPVILASLLAHNILIYMWCIFSLLIITSNQINLFLLRESQGSQREITKLLQIFVRVHFMIFAHHWEGGKSNWFSVVENHQNHMYKFNLELLNLSDLFPVEWLWLQNIPECQSATHQLF